MRCVYPLVKEVFKKRFLRYYNQQSDSQVQKNKSGSVDSQQLNLCFSVIFFVPNFVPFYLLTNRTINIKSKINNYLSVLIVKIKKGVDIINPKCQENIFLQILHGSRDRSTFLKSCIYSKDIYSNLMVKYSYNYFTVSKLINPQNITE